MPQIQGIDTMSQTMRTFVQIVRSYMRDVPELNRITAGQETGDRLVAWCVLDAISRFNGTPHFTSYSLDDLLQRNQHHLMLRLTVIAVIESVGLLQTRNHINYSDGGLNVGVNDKTPLLMNWLQYYQSYSAQLLTRTKVALNIEGILGPSNSGVFSEYWSVNLSYLQF